MIEPVIRAILIDSGQIEPSENFYPVQDYEDKYLISPLGKIYIKRTQRLLKPFVNKPGKYLYLNLYKDKKTVKVGLHRLVAQHFVPNILGKKEVHHVDNDVSNNIWSNLEWTTRDENLNYMKENMKNRRKPSV
jgi:hypothetical protein